MCICIYIYIYMDIYIYIYICLFICIFIYCYDLSSPFGHHGSAECPMSPAFMIREIGKGGMRKGGIGKSSLFVLFVVYFSLLVLSPLFSSPLFRSPEWINTITINALNKDPIFIDKNTFGVFKNSENNINFSFYINNYEKYIETKYQYQLIGIHDNWSNWSTDHEALFENWMFWVWTNT